MGLLTPVLALLLGCSAAPVPCRSPEQCGSGAECLAHRCVPVGAEPVPPGSVRLVIEPVAAAVVHPHRAETGLPPTVTFGGPNSQSEQLALRFPSTWSALQVDAAFLLLHPALNADPTGRDVEVTVALAGAPWSSGTLRRSPPGRPPASLGRARTRPPALLRLDVTAQLRAFQEHIAPDYGFVIRAESESARGATYLTGADGGAPQLEVYGRPKATSRRAVP